MVAMATCGNHEHALHSPIGDPVPLIRCTPPHPVLLQRGVLTVTDPPTGQRTFVPCYLSMADQCRRWVLVIWTPLVQISCLKHPDRPLPPTPTHPSQHTGHSPLQVRQTGGISPLPNEANEMSPGETCLCYPGSCLGRWKGNGYLRMNRRSWAYSRHIWSTLNLRAADKKAGISNTESTTRKVSKIKI